MNIKHGMRYHKAYNAWNHMMFRCYSKKDKRYEYYGAKGISVETKWHNFIGFWDDMKDGWKEGLTLDRVDNNGNYCKENCRWTTQTTQVRNRSISIKIEIEGITKTLKEWCDERKLDYNMVYQRIKIYKQNPLTALSQKSRIKNKRKI